MMEKISKYKNYLIGVIGILLALTIFVGIKLLLHLNYENLPEIKLQELNDNKSFAIMVPNERKDGYVEYSSNDNTWPGVEYIFKEAKCVDNNGSIINNVVTFADGKVTLTTNKTIYCTMYFDKSIIGKLIEHAVGGEDATTFTETDVDGMYRYKGTKDEVTNNYICFGTDKKDTCLGTPETYMYRIIGVTDKDDNTINLPANSLKIIKATTSKTGQQWNSVNSDVKWDDSDMKAYLNEIFLPEVVNKWENGSYWESTILEHKWYTKKQENIGAVEDKDVDNISLPSKIGLMYISDYYNSFDYQLINPGYDNPNTSSWLHIVNGWDNVDSTGFDWTMSRTPYHDSNVGFIAWRVRPDGGLGGESLEKTHLGTRPTFYLTPNITLTGDGKKENPYIIHSI